MRTSNHSETQIVGDGVDTIKRKFVWMALVALTITTMLASCGPAPNSSPSVKGDVDGVLKDAMESAFTETGEDTFTKEYDGYSCEVTVKTWGGMQGEDAWVLHPANSDIAISPKKNAELVVPFAIEIACTTPDSSFSTDVRMRYDMIWGRDRNATGNRFQIFLTYDQSIEDSKSAWKERVSYDTSLSKTSLYEEDNSCSVWSREAFALENPGQTMQKDEVETVYGYVVVPDYYSPAHPDGDDSVLPNTFGIALDFGLATDNSQLGWDGMTAQVYEEEERTGEPNLSGYDCFVPFEATK